MSREKQKKEKLKKHKLLSPIDFESKDKLIKKRLVGKMPYYSKDFIRGDENKPKDTMKDHTTDLGGTIDSDVVIDEDTVGSEAGTPGHQGIDEDTG